MDVHARRLHARLLSMDVRAGHLHVRVLSMDVRARRLHARLLSMDVRAGHLHVRLPSMNVRARTLHARSLSMDGCKRTIHASVTRRAHIDKYAGRFGAILKRLREAKGWTLRDLGHKAGMNRNYLQALEYGQNVPTLSTVIRLAKVFGVEAAPIVAEIEKD
jgi:DNA-binding XRE family transcriptional regulator